MGDMTSTRKGCETGKSGRGWFYGNLVCLTPKQRSRGTQGEARPKARLGYKYNPLGVPRTSIDPSITREPPNWGTHTGGSRRPPSSTLPRRWLRLDPSRHGWPCVVKPWWDSGAVPWCIKAHYIEWWYQSNLVSLLWSTLMIVPSLPYVYKAVIDYHRVVAARGREKDRTTYALSRNRSNLGLIYSCGWFIIVVRGKSVVDYPCVVTACGREKAGGTCIVGSCPLIGVRDRSGYHLGRSYNEEDGGLVLPKVVLPRGGRLCSFVHLTHTCLNPICNMCFTLGLDPLR